MQTCAQGGCPHTSNAQAQIDSKAGWVPSYL